MPCRGIIVFAGKKAESNSVPLMKKNHLLLSVRRKRLVLGFFLCCTGCSVFVHDVVFF